ncbi:MAG TPA: phosphatase PAP2 family protein [Tepidiformaceae bacterium]|nr:phosphatase PAP2 family protein [Tepidiformaceae bacterium]
MTALTRAATHSRIRSVSAGVAMWALAAGLALLHESLRARADDGRGHIDGAGLERAVFHGEPGAWLQTTFDLAHSPTAHWATLAVYVAWFPVMPLAALFVFVRERRHFLPFLTFVFVVVFIGDLCAWLWPVSPPWMEPGVTRLIVRQGQDVGGADPNPFAAFPSLHAAVPMAAGVYILLRTRERRFGLAMVAFAVATGIAVVVMGEHWVIDVLAGWVIVGAVAIAATFVLKPGPAEPLEGGRARG